VSDSDYRLKIVNAAPWPVVLTVGQDGGGYSSCITMGDDSLGLSGNAYIPAGGDLTLHFWRAGSCHGEQGWLALRMAYNPLSAADDYQQYWFDTDGGFEKQGRTATYPNDLASTGREGDTALFTATFTDAADWPADWSRTPLDTPYALAYTNQFQPVWNDEGSGAIFNGAVFAPTLDGYFRLGFLTVGPRDYEPVGGLDRQQALMIKPLEPGVVVPPDSYTWIGDDHNSGAHQDVSWWQPNPPAGFIALTQAFIGSHGVPPDRGAIACLRADLVGSARSGKMTYADRGSGGSHDLQTFQIFPAAAGQLQAGITAVSPSYVLGEPPAYAGPLQTIALPQSGDKPGQLSMADVQHIIETYGPLLRLHPNEQYLPLAAPEYINACTLEGNHLVIRDPAIEHGDLDSAQAYVVANWVSEQYTDLQFWFCYGYNGAPTVQVHLWVATGGDFLWEKWYTFPNLNCGQHQGDWEHVTLRVDNATKLPIAAGYSSHGDTNWYTTPPDGQVVAYAAQSMHGTYPVPGDHSELTAWQEKDLTLAHLEVEVFSINSCADGGPVVDASKAYSIVRSNFLTVDTPFWMEDDYKDIRWGAEQPHHDDLVFDGIPVVGSYTYGQDSDDEGPSTPSLDTE